MPSTLKREDQTQEYYDEKFNSHPDLQDLEKQAGDFDDIERNYDKTADSTDENRNIERLREKEEAVDNTFGYDKKATKEPTKILGVTFTRRKSIFAGIATLLLGGGGLVGFILTPAALPVTLMEHFTNDLDDSAGWNSRKVNKLFGTKLDKMQKKTGYCGAKITIRCKFSTMSSYQANNFKKAGIEFEGETKKFGGRTTFTGMTFTDPDTGEKVTARDPAELNRALRQHPHVRSTMYKGFNPITGKFLGNTFNKVLSSAGTSKAKKIKGNTDSETNETYTSSNSDPGDEDATDGKRASSDDETVNEDDTQEEKDRKNSSNAANSQPVQELNESIEKGENKVKIKKGGAVGFAQAACTLYTTASLISAASKTAKYVQLAKFAMIFLTGAAAVKAGEATEAEVKKLANILVPSSYPKTIETEDGKVIENPDIGKNALDSEAYKIVAYGAAGSLSAIAGKFIIGGGMPGKLGSIVNSINKNPTAKSTMKGACKVIKSKFVTFLNFASTFTGMGGIIKTALGFAAGALAAPYLEKMMAYLFDKVVKWATGKDLTTDITGPQAGNAIFVGASFLLGGSAAYRGMKPGKSNEIVKNMTSVSTEYDELASVERYNARNTPLDASNQYAFLGSIISSIRGDSVTPSDLLKNTLARTASLINPVNMFATASAATNYSMPVVKYTEDRFKQCPDDNYNNAGIDADMFCNVRMVPFEDREIDSVVDYMVSKSQIDEESGEALDDSQYSKWIAACSERSSGWGEDSEIEYNGDDTGKTCLENTEDNINFANYKAYYEANTDMDEEVEYPASSSDTEGGTEFRIASFNVLGASHDNDPGRNIQPWDVRIKNSLDTITGNNFDVIGFQELEPVQSKYLLDNLSGYARSTKGKESDGIMWNTAKYTKTDEGSWQSAYFGGPEDEPWVKLQDVATQQEFYVMNVHDPINKGSANAATRTENAKKHLEKVKELSANAPVFLTGDFNGGFSKDVGAGTSTDEGTAYCILTKDGTMNHTYDLSVSRDVKCPNRPSDNPGFNVDHIYATKEVQVDANSYKATAQGSKENGSDHPAVYVDVSIPGSGIANTGPGTNFIAATYNQPVRGNEQAAISAIKSRKFDVVGMQEIARDNYGNIKRGLGDANYGVYPDVKQNVPAVGCSSDHSIFYNKNTFKLVKGDSFSFPRERDYREVADCGNGESKKEGFANAPYVILEDIRPKYAGQQILFINTHNVAYRQNAERRYRADLIYIEQIKKLNAEYPGLPIFFTGDFNEGTGARSGAPTGGQRNMTYEYDLIGDKAYKNLLFCMLAEENLLKSAAGPKGKCGNFGVGGVDYIYISPYVEVESVDEFIDPSTNDAPHPVVFARLNVPSSGTTDNYNTPNFKANPSVQVNEPGSRCTGNFTAGAESLRQDILKRWSLIKTIGGYSCRANTANPNELSVHAVGRALDIMVDASNPEGLKTGDEIRNYLINNATALGVQRVIWNRHIWSANIDGWRDYSGPNPHTDHVHAEINLKASNNANLAGS